MAEVVDLMAALEKSLIKARYHVSRSGLVHDYHCFALTHDGPCDCDFEKNAKEYYG